jgi:SAM-dependent methyltransferase
MLAVLDYYAPGSLSAAFYDLVCRVDETTANDGAFYAGLIKPASRVLELGSGTGRLTFDLASRGHEVVGVDCSEPMLYRANLRLAKLAPDVASRVRLVRGDMRTVSLKGRFDLVIVPFFSLAHVAPDQWGAVFKNIRRHMAPGAVAAVHLPAASLMAIPPPNPPHEPVLSVQYAPGERLTLYVAAQTFRDGRFEQILDYVVRDSVGRELRRSRERLAYFHQDPRPHATAARLVPSGEPIEQGAGEMFLFAPA